MLRRSRLFLSEAASVPPSRRLVFNPFSGRMMPHTAGIFSELAGIGITESGTHKGMLAVTHAERLNAFASTVRADPEYLPASWPRRMRNLLGGMLRSVAEGDDASDLLNEFFKKSALDKMYQRDITGAIGAAGGNTDEEFFGNTGVGFERPTLSSEQRQIVDFALKGFNMFICGDAGTGKTVTLKELVHELRQKKLTVAVTASTGLAACHLGGTTFHSFSGIGKSNDFLQCNKVMPIADVIVIDEISMLSGSLIENFDEFLRGERNCNEPFGGSQIIICGDFLQLSFIPASRTDTTHAFELEVFRNHFLFCKLVKQVRQAGNDRFAQQLRELRVGNIPSDLFAESNGILKIDDPEQHPVDDETIRLLPTNEQVSLANKVRLDKLPGDIVTFVPSATPPTLSGDWSTSVILEIKPAEFNLDIFKNNLHKFMLENMPIELSHYVPRSSIVAYKSHEDGVVARIMMPTQKPEIAAKVAAVWEKAIGKMPWFTLNMDASTPAEPSAKVMEVLPNGVGLHTQDIEERLNEAMNSHPVAQALPLKVGAPVLLRVNLSNRLVNGSVGTVVDYVPATPEKLPGFLLRSPRLAKALEQYTSHARFALGNDDPMIPLVRFRGNEKQDVPIPPVPFNVGGDVGTNYYSIDAISVPLTLAFAFTVHKVQGLTLLAKVRLELEKMWNCQHIVYVAMSRVKRPEQLSISGWKDELVQCNINAVSFDNNVPPVSEVEARLLKVKNRFLDQFCSDAYCNNAAIANLEREATMCRATWWRLDTRDFSTGRVPGFGAGATSSLADDGFTVRTGSSTGAMLNAKQANRVFKSAANKDFSFTNKAKKGPSLFMKSPASKVQHRPAIATTTTTTTTETETATLTATTTATTTTAEQTEKKLPPLFLNNNKNDNNKSTTNEETKLEFGMEPKTSQKRRQQSSSSSTQQQQQQSPKMFSAPKKTPSQ